MTRLAVTRRTVALDRADEYLALWGAVRAAAESLACRAWLFRAARRDDHFLEFLEHAGDQLPLDQSPLRDARRELHESFPPDADDEWAEAPIEIQP